MLGRSALLAATNSENYGNWLGNYSDVSLLLRGAAITSFANPPLDESPTPKAITTVGNASVTTAVARWNQGSGGSSLAFDGSGDYLTFPPSVDFQFNLGDYTIEWWQYIISFPHQYFSIVHIGQLGNTGNFSATLGIRFEASGTFFRTAYGNSNVDFTTPTPALGIWEHYALVRVSGISKLFKNGIQIDSDKSASLNVGSPPSNGAIGGAFFGSGGGGLFSNNGYIDDLRITKGIARYETGTGANAGKMVFAGTNNFADPNTFGELQTNTGPNPDPSYNSVSLLLRNGTPSSALLPFDESPTPKAITTFGNAGISTTIFRYGTSSLAFDGSGDYLIPSSESDFAFGTGDFTVEMWIRFNNVNTTQLVYDSRPGTQGAYPCLLLESSTIRYVANDAYRITSASVSANTWIHIALCRSSGSTRLFIDGQQSGVTFSDSNNYLNPASRPLIGGNGFSPSGTNNLNGYIDDLRITKGVARYTSNFTPPPAELPNF